MAIKCFEGPRQLAVCALLLHFCKSSQFRLQYSAHCYKHSVFQDALSPILVCKTTFKSISNCYFADEAYRSFSTSHAMLSAVGKGPAAISTQVMSPYCSIYLSTLTKGY